MRGLASLDVGQWLGAAGVVAAVLLVIWLERRSSTWLHGFASFLLLFGMTHLLLPGESAALWAALALTALIGTASKLKYRYLGFNLLAGDFYHLSASAFRPVVVDHARTLVPVLAGMALLVALVIAMAMAIPEPAVQLTQRLEVFGATAAVYLALFLAGGGSRRFEYRHWINDRAHLSAFVASWFGAGPSRRPAFLDIDPDPLPFLPATPGTCPAVRQAPHIIMILHESTFDPRQLGVAVPPSFERFFTPPNGLSGTLHVDVFGGSTLQTEFSVLTGLSSLSFGGDSRFVYHLLSGRVRHALPLALAGLRYNVSHISCDRPNFVNCGQFYSSIGFEDVSYADTLPPPFDAARWRRERHDEQLYGHALASLSQRATADRPCFLSIATLMNHGDHRRHIFPIDWHASLRGEAMAATGSELYGEYAVRLAESVEACEGFTGALQVQLAGQPAIIVRYGDHQPSFTTSLTGLPPSDPALRQTFYAIEAMNCALPDHLEAPPVLDSAFLSTLTMLAAGLPLDPVFATRASLLDDCAALYYDSGSLRKLRFHRALVEAGIVRLD
jgi:hypothetical protein